MKRIKLFEEFNADMPIQDMIKMELKKEIETKIKSDANLTNDDLVNYYYELTTSRKLADDMANDIFHELVGDGVFNTTDEETFKDDNGNFTFTLEEIEVYEEETHYIGTLECPDHVDGDRKRTLGFLHGSIIAYKNGQIVPEFGNEKEGLDIWDFCEGLEYELDGFLDYVVDELKQKNQ